LWRTREDLYARVDARIDAMLAAGLLDEVRGLAARGYGWALPAMSSVGYAQLGVHLRGECSLAEAVAMIRRATRRFVRRQANWFKREDPRMRWYAAAAQSPAEFVRDVQGWLERSQE
jgi:tRNA dimethylallyltransferase